MRVAGLVVFSFSAIVPYAACDTAAPRRAFLADQAPRKPTERVATPYDRPRGGGKVREPEG